MTYNLADPDMSLMDIGTAEGTAGFEMGEEGYSKDDVIALPIRSRDENGHPVSGDTGYADAHRGEC